MAAMVIDRRTKAAKPAKKLAPKKAPAKKASVKKSSK
tara:strand:- start:403 stop:513 length:111 start_codon:yes stop_codon:yes gene_type:complete